MIQWLQGHMEEQILIKITREAAFHSNLTAREEDISSVPSDSTTQSCGDVLG